MRVLLLLGAVLTLLGCSQSKEEERYYLEGISGKSGIKFGQAFFEVDAVEAFSIANDPHVIYMVQPMQFSVTECQGIVVHAQTTDTVAFRSDFKNLPVVRDGVYRRPKPGVYLVVSRRPIHKDSFAYTDVWLESGDLPCAISWLETRLFRASVWSASEIRQRER